MTTRIKVCRCGKEFEATGGKRICPLCSEQKNAAYDEREQSENLDRARTPVEVLVELYMQKYSPASDSLTPRQHLALDRKIIRQTKKALAAKHPLARVWREFEFRLFVIAYRRGVLTNERWTKLRRMYPFGDAYKKQLAVLYQDVMGKPIKQRLHGYYGESYLHADDLSLVLPLLRKMFDDPEYKPPTANWEDKNGALLNRLLQSEDSHGGRYGYLPSTRQQVEAKSAEIEVAQEEPIDSEQIAHGKQDEIDAVAAELLDSIDWGGL